MHKSTDEIRIKGVKLYAYHGCLQEEKEKGQEFTLDITLHLNLGPAGRTDDLDRTVNYSAVCEEVAEAFSKYSYNLIEAVAEEIAEMILIKHNECDAVEIELFKPHAPIPLDFENVSVYLKRTRHIAYIAVGSNIGDGPETIEKAAAMFEKHPGNRILKKSDLITTKPYGVTDQPDFTNGMWMVETLLEPLDLLKKLNEIEARLGRERLIHWGPRTMDLDIIYYDDLVLDSEKLTIPHIDMANREFVLRPLNEVDPYVRHPLNKMRASEMLEILSK